MITLQETEHTHPHRHLSSRQRMVLTAAGVIMLLGVLVAIWIGLARSSEVQQELTEAQDSIAKISEENNQILQTIEGCTSEEGACYEDNQARTAILIQSLRRTIIYANWCTEQNQDASLDVIEACVERLLTTNETR